MTNESGPSMEPRIGGAAGGGPKGDEPSGADSFVKQSGQTFLTRVANVLVQATLGILLARVLGAHGKGQLTILLLIPTTLSTLTHLSIASANTYYTGRKEIPASRLFGGSILLAGVVSVISIGGTLLFFPWITKTVLIGISPILAILAMLTLPMDVLTTYLQHITLGLRQMAKFNLVEFSSKAGSFVAVLVFIYVLKLGVKGAIYGFLFGSFVAAALAFAFLLGIGAPDFRIRKAEMLKVLRYGLQSHAFFVLAFLTARLGMFILKYKTEDAVVGVFSVAATLSELVFHIPDSIGFVLFSRVAGATQEESAKLSTTVCRNTVLLTVIACIIGFFAGPPLVAILYGKEFIESGVILRWLLPGTAVYSIFRILHRDLLGRGKPHLVILATGSALPVTVFVTWALADRLKGVGAALGVVAGYSVAAIIVLLVFSRQYKIRLAEAIVPKKSDFAIYGDLFQRYFKRSK